MTPQNQPYNNNNNTPTNNNGLYFIVGAIFIAVVALGAMFLTGTETGEDSVQGIETAAGDAANDIGESAEQLGDDLEDATDADQSRFEIESDDDGVSVETNTTN